MDRIQKLIAAAGICSRRNAESLIREGRVTLNGRAAEIGDSADPNRDRVCVDGAPIGSPTTPLYILLHKPAGYVTTMRDPHAEKTVMDLIQHQPGRVFPVGRLDRDTTGLLLLTSDGEFANRLSHPSSGVEKVYEARVDGLIEAGTLRQLERGIELEDGPTAPARARLAQVGRGQSVVEITVHEGRNRQVRRMLDAVGHRVKELARIKYGPLELGTLRPGEWRYLSDQEVRSLKAACKTKSRMSSERAGDRATANGKP